MSQKKSPENEHSNERGSQSDTQINEPSNEKSSQSGTQENQRSGQKPMPVDTSKQNKCGVCGQTFSNQNELHNHYKTSHNMEAPAQQSKGEGGSSSSGSRWSGEMGKETGSQNKTQNQYKCQKDGQTFSSQNDLNEHNKKVHGTEPGVTK